MGTLEFLKERFTFVETERFTNSYFLVPYIYLFEDNMPNGLVFQTHQFDNFDFVTVHSKACDDELNLSFDKDFIYNELLKSQEKIFNKININYKAYADWKLKKVNCGVLSKSEIIKIQEKIKNYESTRSN